MYFMEITDNNFAILLTGSITEMTMIVEKLKDIVQDIPDTHRELEILDARFMDAMEPLEGIIKFIVENKPNPEIVGNNLRNAVLLMSEILKEKTRIIKDTPPLLYQMNNLTALN